MALIVPAWIPSRCTLRFDPEATVYISVGHLKLPSSTHCSWVTPFMFLLEPYSLTHH